MFCSKCGKQLSDNTRFCDNCGAQQQINGVNDVNKDVVDVLHQPPKKGTKKKTNIIIVLVVALCAFIIGRFVIAPSMMSETKKGYETTQKSVQTEQTTETSEFTTVAASNPDYEAVFENTYMVHFPFFFNMDMANFAIKQEDGSIGCSDFGYENDVVKQWQETIYIPIAGYTDIQKTELENMMRSEFASLEALSCCTVTYKMSINYLTVTCTYNDVDKKENYSELYEAGILEMNTFISMSATEESLLNQGFAKK